MVLKLVLEKLTGQEVPHIYIWPESPYYPDSHVKIDSEVQKVQMNTFTGNS